MAFLRSLPGWIREKIYGAASESAREVSGPNSQSSSGETISGLTSGSDETPGQCSSTRDVSGPNSQTALDETPGQCTSSREVSGPNCQSTSVETPGQRSSVREVSGSNSQSASDETPGQFNSAREVSVPNSQSASDKIPGQSDSARDVSGPNSQSASGPVSSSCQSIIKREPFLQELHIGAHNPQSEGKPTIHKLQLTDKPNSVNSKAKTKKCVYGNRSPASFREKTVMVVGGTGAGKSTMINSVVNHIMGIRWEDDFRLSIIDLKPDEMENRSDESNSQTEWITCYTIPEGKSKLDYTLNIIDTPGFGDTRGMDRDREHVDHLRVFFNSSGEQGIQLLDAVWLVVKSSDTRLTESVKYVLDSILSIFGIDIEKSIFVLVTFADNKNPPVLNTLRNANVPVQIAFAFNNSALFEYQEDHEVNSCRQHYWARNTESFRQLFDELGKTMVHSIQLSAEVLKIRKQLETTIKGMHMHVNNGLERMAKIKKEEEIVKDHKRRVDANKDYEYEVEKEDQKMIDITGTGNFVTNCENCNSTCHYPCAIPRTEDKANCSAMCNGMCTVCIQKCAWNHHFNSHWRIETKYIKVKMTYENIVKEYMKEKKNVKEHQTILERIKEEYNETREDVSDAITCARESLNRLKEIALQKDLLSHVEYIEMLIKCEEREKKEGFLDRVEMLHAIKDQAILLANVSQGKPLTGFLGEL